MTLQDYFMEHVQLQKEWAVDKNTVIPGELTPRSRTKVWWRCEKGHEWQVSPDARISMKRECPHCSGRNAIPGETDLATTHPEILKFWSKRNTVDPHSVTAGSHKKVWFLCERGHEWEARVDTYVFMESGCPYCAGKRAMPGETDLATLRPDLMEQWDFEKNTLKPSEVTVASHDKAWWKCELGHSWSAIIFSRTRENGAGCPYCTGRRVLLGFNDLATLKPKLAEEWHKDLNGTLKPEDVTLGSNKKVWWQCRDGHVWQAAVYSRTRRKGTGCPVCAGTVKQSRTVQRYERSRKGAESAPVSINI